MVNSEKFEVELNQAVHRSSRRFRDARDRASGNLLKVTDSVIGQWTYTYDTLNRLRSTTPSTALKLRSRYDALGNRKAEAWQSDCSSVAETKQYNTKNQVTVSSVNSAVNGFVYDAAGNLVKDNHLQYALDGEGRAGAVAYDSDGKLAASVCNCTPMNFQKQAVYRIPTRH